MGIDCCRATVHWCAVECECAKRVALFLHKHFLVLTMPMLQCILLGVERERGRERKMGFGEGKGREVVDEIAKCLQTGSGSLPRTM